MEFETHNHLHKPLLSALLKFTPLEFETICNSFHFARISKLKFTPLEFETILREAEVMEDLLLKFTPLEFETNGISWLS